MRLRVVLSGGGTGGHVYPALAIAEAVRRRVADVSFLYVGTADGMEAEIVPRQGLPFRTVAAGGVIRKSPVAAARGLVAMARGVWQARRLLAGFGPHVVVGTGGYVSGPVLLAAALAGIPTLVHEQNAVPGVTNRLLSRFADVVAVPHPDVVRRFPSARRVEVTGNPVRSAVLAADPAKARARLGLAGCRWVVAVLGGSRGARTINEAVAGLLPAWLERPDRGLVWVTGRAYHDAMVARAREAGYDPERHGHVRILPYAHAVEDVLAAADLVVARAGALTLAELAARGRPAVLVPSPNVAHDEQRHNARLAEAEGAAVILEDDRCDAASLDAVLEQLLADPARLAAMAAAARRLARPDAADRLADLVLELARGGRRRAG